MPTLLEQIADISNLEWAYHKSQKNGGKYKGQALRFEKNRTANLKAIQESLLDGSYEFTGYTRFTVYEPKERIIDAPCLKDKIVQLAILKQLKPIYYPSFIHDTYACIDGKGTHKAAARIHKFMRQAKWRWGEEATIIKIDIRKFFYTIDREHLKSEVSKKIYDPGTKGLVFKIIDSAKKIADKGLPLGNTLSQLGASISMNPLDQYAKRRLALKYYVRYADDIVIIVKDKETAQDILLKMLFFIENTLNLEANKKKTKLFPISQGVNAIGYKIHATHMLLRDDCKKKIKKKAKKMQGLLDTGKMKVEKAEQILNSWLGHASHGNSYNFIRYLVNRFTYIIYENQKLKIKECESYC